MALDLLSSPIVSPEIPNAIPVDIPTSADRPILLPTQRKLRHIRGVLCRNISLQPASRARSSTQDDDTLRTSWQSPSKQLLEPQQPNGGPHTSLSSGDLKDLIKRPKTTLRRRSTRIYHLGALEDSVFRQKRWEKVVDTKLVDLFFTIHPNRRDDPMYISEQVFETMNPNFECFDLLDGEVDTLRLDGLVIRIYAKSHTSTNYSLLVEHDIALCCLQFIGKDIGQFHHPFPTNSVIIQLTDGFYTAFNAAVTHHHPLPSIADIDSRILTTCSYSTMLELTTLEDVIRDTVHSREEIKTNIERLLAQPHTSHFFAEISESKQSLTQTQSALQSQRKALQAARKKVQTLRTSIQLRKESMHKGLQSQAQSQNHLLEARATLEERKNTQKELTVSIAAQRRRICLDLQKIYPIDSVDDETLRFTIRGINLPAAGKYESVKEEELATALGWTAHLVYLISGYLRTPLRYPVQPVGGRSLIRDPVSVMMGSRTFPLYASGGDQHRFDYAVFLLNKNIEQLMNSQMLHVMDLRSTLANLKYLMLYLTATTSAMLPPPPVRRSRAEAIPVKKVLGVFDNSGGGSSASSSLSGTGNGSFRTGFGRIFGGGGGVQQ